MAALTYPLVDPLNKLVGNYQFHTLTSLTINSSADDGYDSGDEDNYSCGIVPAGAERTIKFGYSPCVGTQTLSIGGTTDATGSEIITIGTQSIGPGVGTRSVSIGTTATDVCSIGGATITTAALSNAAIMDQSLATTANPTFVEPVVSQHLFDGGYQRFFVSYGDLDVYLDDISGSPIPLTAFFNLVHLAPVMPVNAFATFHMGDIVNRSSNDSQPAIYAILYADSNETNDIQFRTRIRSYNTTTSSQSATVVEQEITTVSGTTNRILIREAQTYGEETQGVSIQRVMVSGTEYTGNLYLLGFELVYPVSSVL